jgi:hypothetical protein
MARRARTPLPPPEAPAQYHSPVIGGAQTDFTAQPQDPPFAGPQAVREQGPIRKLTHFRKPGAGAPMWSGACVYGLSGATPSMSQYDVNDTLSDEFSSEIGYRVRAGVVTFREPVPVDEPSMTRNARVSAHLDSSPAARFFQGTFNTRWSGLMAGFRPQIRPRPLAQNFNPNQKGSKELHPATQYKPFPPMGSIVPAYGEAKAL